MRRADVAEDRDRGAQPLARVAADRVVAPEQPGPIELDHRQERLEHALVRVARPEPLHVGGEPRRATLLLEQAAHRPRLELGDAAAIRSALALPRATPLEAWERKGALEQARRAGMRDGWLLQEAASHGAALARAHASVAPDEAARLLLALRRVGLRLGSEAVTIGAASDGAAIVKAADEGLLATAREPQAWLAARDELDRLSAIDREATLAEVALDLPTRFELEHAYYLVSTPEGREVKRLDQQLLRALLGHVGLWSVAGCALAFMISQWGPALTLRLQPKQRDPVRLLPPAPWTLRDDLAVALGSYGVVVALSVLLVHSAPLRPISNDELLRLLCVALALLAWPGLSVHALVRGRVLATHRRAWRVPARVHLGLALGLAGLLLVAASFEGLLGLVAGVTTGLAGLVLACAGGALGERDPDLERAFARESQHPLMRAHALGIALACAASLLHVAPWRAGLMQRYATARASMIEQAPKLRRDRLQALRRGSPEAPRARSEFEGRRSR